MLKKIEEILKELLESIRKDNIRMMGIPQGEEREKGTESSFKEIITENFLNLGKELDIQVHEAKRTPNYLNAKRPSPRHIILKLPKVNDKEIPICCWWKCKLVQPLWKSMEISNEIKNRTTIGSSYFISGYLYKKYENTNLKRYMHPYVHCSIKIAKIWKQPM